MYAGLSYVYHTGNTDNFSFKVTFKPEGAAIIKLSRASAHQITLATISVIGQIRFTKNHHHEKIIVPGAGHATRVPFCAGQQSV